MGKIYNLQIKLDTNTRDSLCKLAKEDCRSLTNYCYMILKKQIEGNSDLEVVEEKHIESNSLECKKKIKKTSKVISSPSKDLENAKETITLDSTTPSIIGHFGVI